MVDPRVDLNRNKPEDALRHRAEERFRERIACLPKLSPEEIAELVQELETHRAELQMKNEGLRAARQTLEESRDRYVDLFDHAPLGYVTLDGQGWIHEINLTAARMLEVEREGLVRKPVSEYIVAEDRHLLAGHLARCRESIKDVTSALRLLGKQGRITPVEIRSTVAPSPEGGWWCRTVISDITERKQADEALRLSEETFSHTFQAAAAAMALTRIGDGYILNVNERWLELMECSRDEVVGKTAVELGVWKDLADRAAIVRELQAHGFVRGRECALRSRRGRQWTAMMSARIFTVGGEQVITSSAIDITERKRAETALRESEERLRLFIEHAPASIAMFDRQMRYLAVSRRWMAEYLPGRENVIGRYHYEVFPECPERWRAAHRRALLGEIVRENEDTWTMADGRTLWARYEVHPWYAADGIGGIVLFTEDITERKRAEEALRESEARIQQALNVSRSFAFEWSLATDEVQRSASCGTILNLTGDEAVRDAGQRYFQRVHPDDRARFVELVSTLTPSRPDYATEYRVVRRDGSVVTLEEIGQGVFDATGKLARLTGVSTDITARKRAEEELKALNATLEQRVAERTAESQWRAIQLQRLAAQMTQTEERERRRLAQVLHDGLQQVLFAAKLRLGTALKRVQDERAAAAIKETLNYIDESIAESRSLTKELSPPVLYDGGLAAGLEWLGRETEKKYQLPVTVEVAPELEPDDLTTKVFVFQAARELVLNAVKHAHASSLRISLSGADDKRLQVVIKDDGTGFNTEAIGRKEGGGGFGLFSIQERLNVIGGGLAITSSPLEGTKATILAPCQRVRQAVTSTAGTTLQQAPLSPEGAAEGITRIRVLLADDHPVLRKGLAEMLREHPGLNVVGEAKDGQEALEMAVQSRPDVVLMDITMPRMDGIEATRQIKRAVPEVHVIGLSMHETQEMVDSMKNAGASEYLTKTVPLEDMLAAIMRTCART